MGRHILDHQKTSSEGTALESSVMVERVSGDAGPHPTTTALQRRPRTGRAESRRAEAFIRVERQSAGPVRET